MAPLGHPAPRQTLAGKPLNLSPRGLRPQLCVLAQGSQLSWRGSPSVGWGSGHCRPGPGKKKGRDGGRVMPVHWPALGSTGAARHAGSPGTVHLPAPGLGGSPDPAGSPTRDLPSSALVPVPGDSLRRGICGHRVLGPAAPPPRPPSPASIVTAPAPPMRPHL